MLMTMLTLTTGSAFIMWLGEQISERGIGNGMSLIIFAGIVVGLPRAVAICGTRPRRSSGAVHGVALLGLDRPDAGGGRVHRVRRRRPAAHSGAVRQARDGAPRDGRADDLPAAAREFRGRDSADFASSLLTFPQTLGADFSEQVPFFDRSRTSISWGEPLYT
jgi:preprotein translocase subunit SecY